MSKRGDKIRKRADGRWEGRVKIGSYPDGKTKYKSLYGKTYREVREKMNLFVPENTDCHDGNCKTLAEIMQYWIKNSNINRKQSSVYKYEYLMEKHILPSLGNVRTNQLNSALINEFLSEKLKNGRLDGKGGLSNSYVRTMAVIIQSAIDFCVKENQCSNCVISLIKPTIPKKEVLMLSKQWQDILNNEICKDTDSVKLGTMISLQAGLRIGEVCALTWDDIDFENNLFHIRHTISRISAENTSVKSKLIIDTPKTTTSVRDIPISSVLKPYLLTQKAKSNSFYVVSDGQSFISPRTYEYRYHKLLKNCGLPKLNYHALRHTFATRCVEVGVDIKTLSEFLGHANVSITLNTYVHSTIENKKLQMEKLSSSLA